MDGTSGQNIDGEAPVSETVVETEAVTVTENAELERTIGLSGGLAIGIGTMIGAGIFVLPGLAAGRAGPAAALSFGIGAIIALLVALPTSELATAWNGPLLNFGRPASGPPPSSSSRAGRSRPSSTWVPATTPS